MDLCFFFFFSPCFRVFYWLSFRMPGSSSETVEYAVNIHEKTIKDFLFPLFPFISREKKTLKELNWLKWYYSARSNCDQTTGTKQSVLGRRNWRNLLLKWLPLFWQAKSCFARVQKLIDNCNRRPGDPSSSYVTNLVR